MATESEVYKMQRAEAEHLMEKLAASGILAIYGGGSRGKGHGFWLYQATPEYIARYRADDYTDLVELPPVIQNDGKASGNPAFTMFEDAEKLV